MFPIRNGLKQGDALLPLLFNFALQCAIRRVQLNQMDYELNVTRQLLSYVVNVNILGGNVHTVQRSTENLAVSRKGTELELYADKTKYVIMSLN